MSSKHRTFKKNFETQMRVNGLSMPLNNFIQETLANMMVGFMKTLKESSEEPKTIEIKIKRLLEPIDVDAHIYP